MFYPQVYLDKLQKLSSRSVDPTVSARTENLRSELGSKQSSLQSPSFLMSVTLMRNRFEEEEKSGAEHDDLWHAAVKRERESSPKSTCRRTPMGVASGESHFSIKMLRVCRRFRRRFRRRSSLPFGK